MSLAKSINAWVGYGAEVTHGTKGVIDLFNRIISSNLRHVKDTFTSESHSPDWHQDIYYSAGRNEGSLTFEQVYTGLELFYHSLMGTYTYSVDTPVAGANTHAFTFVPSTNSFPVGLSLEDIRGIGGTDELSYLGMHASKLTLEWAPRQAMHATFDFYGTGRSRSAATSETFPTLDLVLPAHKASLKLGGNELTVLSGSMDIEIPRASEREHYGEAYYKEAVVRGRPVANFSLECEFNDAVGADTDAFLVDFEDENEIVGLYLQSQGDIVTGATQEEFTITGAKAKIKASTPATQAGEEITTVTVEGQIYQGLSFTMINDTAQVT